MCKKPQDRSGRILIHVAYITTRRGRRIYASAYGKKSFAIWVKPR
jgi:hypothetical protein